MRENKSTLTHFAIVRRVVVALIALLLVGWTPCMDFPLSHCWSSDPFMKEIYRASRGNQARRADISDITNRYFPPGSSLKDGLDFLRDRGFEVSPYESINPRTGKHTIDPSTGKQMVPDGEVWYSAWHNRNPFVLVRVTTYVSLKSDGQQVLRTKSRIWLTGL
jgi:hypothetical protein